MKKRTYIWRIATVALLCLLLITQPLLAQEAPADDNGKSQTVYTDWTEDGSVYVPVCTDGDLTLSFKADDMMFRLEKGAATPDTAEEEGEEDESEQPAGTVWYSGMTPENYSRFENAPSMWKGYMTSVLAVTYAGKTETRGNTLTSYSGSSDANVTAKASENGLQFAVEFPDEGLAMTLEVALEDGKFVARIPADSIREDGDYAILEIELLPFFGAVAKETTTDGYLVYPDGSGAITYFDRIEDKSEYTKPVELDIYDTMDVEKTLAEKQDPAAMLPIFGIKQDNTAFLAAITKGEENAKISVNAALNLSAVPIHRSSFKLVYRNSYRIFLSSASAASSTSATANKENFGVKFDPELQKEDREITYFLLTDDQANYSGMANAYRDYLIENGVLKKSEAAARNLFLTLFMGAEKEDAMLDAYVPMTTFEQAQEICQTLIDSGINDLDVLLRGWGQGGYGIYPQAYKTDSDLGGKKGMTAFNKFVGAHEGLSVSLESDLIHTDKNKYIAVKGTRVPITDELEELFLLTPKRASAQLAKVQKQTNRYDNLNLALSAIGDRLYPDYDEDFVTNRFEAVNAWKDVAANDAVAATQGGNLYMLSGAKHLYDLPADSSMQQMTDDSIPWYYMILSGTVSYSTLPGNRTGDLQDLKLQWIEYGAIPTFELTAEKSLNLYGTTYNNLFSSEFAQWKDRVVNITNELSTALKDVKGESIVMHEKLADEQVCVTYANGYRVVINYADEAFDFEGTSVEAQNYVVLAPAN